MLHQQCRNRHKRTYCTSDIVMMSPSIASQILLARLLVPVCIFFANFIDHVCYWIHSTGVVCGESNVTTANCNFDSDFCGYENPKFTFGNFFKTNFQWSRHKGDIKTKTGILLSSSRPLGDHTSGNGEYTLAV